MEPLTAIKPINTKILFQFVEDLDNSTFRQKTQAGIFIVENEENKVNQHRWGKVLAVGPEVGDLVSVGEYILIEALGWTNWMSLDFSEKDAERFWFTDLEKVMCVTDENPLD